MLDNAITEKRADTAHETGCVTTLHHNISLHIPEAGRFATFLRHQSCECTAEKALYKDNTLTVSWYAVVDAMQFDMFKLKKQIVIFCPNLEYAGSIRCPPRIQ